MQAAIGDRLHVHGNSVGHPDKAGEIVEVKGAAGAPPYLVRFEDGHTGLVFPGPDAVVERAHRKGGAGQAKKTGGGHGDEAGAGRGKKAGAGRAKKGGAGRAGKAAR
jgi:Domain of unknown function (DUF1918)